MTTKSLNKLLSEHQNRQFPTIVDDNEELAEWLTDLTDIDGYYAGLASSLSAGNTIDIEPSQSLKKMHQRLEKIKKHTGKTENYFEAYQDYLASIENIAKALERSIENIH